jgi:hypothetical protein
VRPTGAAVMDRFDEVTDGPGFVAAYREYQQLESSVWETKHTKVLGRSLTPEL